MSSTKHTTEAPRLSDVAARAAVPKTRDPFVNTPLLSLGIDERTGRERFWISTYNQNVGPICVLVDEQGSYRMFRPGLPHAGFYSAVMQDQHTLWLCGFTDRLVRLDLNTGAFESFDTGLPGALAFQGMIYDEPTQRIFAASYAGGFTFDIRSQQFTVHEKSWRARCSRFSWPNGDGTWSLMLHQPAEVLRWDPREDSLIPSSLNEHALPTTNRLAYVPAHGHYIPTLGWYDAQHDALSDTGPTPQREQEWFAANGEYVFGCERIGSDLQLSRWALSTGAVEPVARVPDTPPQNVTLTVRGDLAVMSMYGRFQVFDADSGALRMARQVPADSVGKIDCLRLIDRDRLIGTPFITQRFWQINLATGKGRDCGRAAPGAGQVVRTWRMNRRIYMAAYTGGELVNYDPDQRAAFPENPQVVAQHPLAMRPIASESDTQCIYYTCSRKYEHLGTVLFRYDTKMHTASWSVDPIGPRQIRSLLLDREAHELICGSSIHADMNSAEPSVDRSVLARISADGLSVRHVREMAPGIAKIDVIGWVDRDRLLCMTLKDDKTTGVAVVDAQSFDATDTALPPSLAKALTKPSRVAYLGRPGRFAVHVADRLELHDFRRADSRVRVLLKGFRPGRWWFDGDTLLVPRRREVWVVRDLLRSAEKSADDHSATLQTRS